MRNTAWLLTVCLTAAVIGGCSTTRSSVAKNDPPRKSTGDTDEDVRVKYGLPWGKGRDAQPAASTSDLEAQLAKARSGADKKARVPELLQQGFDAEARAHRAGGNREDLLAAQQAYRDVLAADPQNADAHHRLGVISDILQDYRSADQHYAKALAANPRNPDLLGDIGYSHLLRGDLTSAERSLKDALQANPYHRQSLANLGKVYAQQGRYDDALAMFRQAGTESEAQQQIAQFFPNGRPAAAGAPPRADNRAAPPMPPDLDPRLAAVSVDQLRQQMEQERQNGIRAREQRQQLEQRPNMSDAATALSIPWANGAPPRTEAGRASAGPLVVGPSEAPMAAPNAGAMSPPNSSWPAPSGSGAAPQLPNIAGGAPAPAATGAAPPAAGAAPIYRGPAPATSAPSPWGALGAASPATGAAGAIQPAGYQQPPASNPFGNLAPAGMSEASRRAALMAMGTGPGSLFPAVAPGPVSAAAAMSANPASSGVRWAYGESTASDPNFGAIEQAGGFRAPSQPAAAPNGAAPQPWNNSTNNLSPASPWDTSTSPAPPPIQWGPGQSNADGPMITPGPVISPGPSSAPSAGGPNTLPIWPGASAAGAANWGDGRQGSATMPPRDSLSAYEAELQNGGVVPAGGSFAAPPSAPSRAASAPTQISNWPYAPSRP